MKRPIAVIAAALTVATLLAGCASDPLAQDYLKGGTKNYISGSGITEVAVADRGKPITFSGTTDAGTTLSRSDFNGQVLVVNFWYAACPPCRAEAPDLKALSEKYDGKGASFLGVNVYDSADTSLAFSRKFSIGYPSLLDSKTGDVRLAFAGDISPSAVPTTFVLDKKGRIAARIVGQVQERSILDTIIAGVLAESD